ncbi:MAG: Phosphomethylpyrimidine synthase [Methanonatronarchaeales archaeon]|nr:Phosphomethylpyrimidine synthase [Methanonatronarchaeales archaeon]
MESAIHRGGRSVSVAGMEVGEGASTKVNANVGTSRSECSVDLEVEKALAAQEAGADAVMDLSIGGDLDLVRRELRGALEVPLGSVPVYQFGSGEVEPEDASPDDFLGALENHARDVDFVTVHAGVTRETLDTLERSGRTMGIVSRGGHFTQRYVRSTGEENPFYEHFGSVLDIAEEHGLVLSLGDGLRPGCIGDSGDAAKYHEARVLGELVERSRERGVGAMVEGPGHVPLHRVEEVVRRTKELAGGAPLYLLGPLVTDAAAGYDHVSAAIGGAVAGMNGADFLCYVTPAEHLGLPGVDDVVEGVRACRVAAHAADVAEGVPGAREGDDRVAGARASLDWEAQFRYSLFPDVARERWRSSGDACSMCDTLCPMKR